MRSFLSICFILILSEFVFSQIDSVVILEMYKGEYIITNFSTLQNNTDVDTSFNPNPFAPITKFRFIISEKEDTEIILSDTNSIQFLNIKLDSPSPGTYSINFYEFVYDLPSGTYYVSIVNSHQNKKKKIVISK